MTENGERGRKNRRSPQSNISIRAENAKNMAGNAVSFKDQHSNYAKRTLLGKASNRGSIEYDSAKHLRSGADLPTNVRKVDSVFSQSQYMEYGDYNAFQHNKRGASSGKLGAYGSLDSHYYFGARSGSQQHVPAKEKKPAVNVTPAKNTPYTRYHHFKSL